MRTVPHKNRTRLLELCPEAKLLFPANHDPRCKVACPRDRAMLDAPLRVWTQRCTGTDAPDEDADRRACELTPMSRRDLGGARH